jgi:CHAT domain-containing protein/tetratricopeptide (TPR) repeat protein
MRNSGRPLEDVVALLMHCCRARGVFTCGLALIASLALLSPAVARHTESAQSGGVQVVTGVRLLRPGEHVERAIARDELHQYSIGLAAGEFLEITVRQDEAIIALTLYSPDKAKLVEVGTPARNYGPQTLVFLADHAALYRLEVRASGNRGRYSLRIETRNDPGQRERLRVSAQQALADAHKPRLQSPPKPVEEKLGYERARMIAREAGDGLVEAMALSYQASAELALGDAQAGLDHLIEASLICRAIGERRDEAELLEAAAKAYKSYFGDLERAFATFDQAIRVLRESGDQGGEASLLFNIALARFDLGDYQEALDLYHQALAIRRAMGDHEWESNILNSIGKIYSSLGNYKVALDYYQQVLALARQENNRPFQAGFLNNIALTYEILGERERAEAYFNESLKAWAEIGDKAQEADQLSNTAIFYERSGDYDKALKLFNQALSSKRDLPNRQKVVATLVDLSQLHLRMGNRQAALESLQEAAAIMPRNPAPAGRATLLNLVGDAWLRLGETQTALDCYEQALKLVQPLQNARAEARSLYKIAGAERALGRFESARKHIEDALKIAETLRSRIPQEEWRSEFFSSIRAYHELYIDLLMQLHKANPSQGLDSEALSVSELARARSLLDLLAEARAGIRRDIDANLLQRERALQQQLNQKAEQQTRLLGGTHTEEQAEGIARDIRALATAFEELEGRVRASDPRYAALMHPQAPSSDTIKRMLDPDTMLLEFSLGRERSYLWLATSDKIESFELPPRAEIESETLRVHALLTARNLRPQGETDGQRQLRISQAEAEFPAAAARLSRMLLGPVAERLRAKRLVIVAEGALHYLPFAVLRLPATDNPAGSNSEPLIARMEVVNLPSVSVLNLLRSRRLDEGPARKAVAVIADPVFEHDDIRAVSARNRSRKASAASVPAPPAGSATSPTLSPYREIERSVADLGIGKSGGAGMPRLAFSRREAEAIAALVSQQEVLKAVDFDASVTTATSAQLAQYRIVHFATHGLLNTQHPELSGVVLSLVDERGAPQDGFLRLNRIYDLTLPADLVVLSSCNSALGKDVRGEGLVGLTRGFMYAGAARTITSLWKVDDAATADLMRVFYQKMLKHGMSPSAALRATQFEMSAHARWHEPYYWAAFTLQGEWR